MKKNVLLLLIAATIGMVSCEKKIEGPTDEYLVATPIKTDLITFKNEAVDISAPIPIVESGKIYAYKDYIFVNDINRGFHIIDNSNPTAPNAIAFLKLEGNYDISVKDDRLFADSYGDLVIFDISDIDNISIISRMENAIYQQFWCTVGFDVAWPEADIFDYSEFDAATEAIVGWEVNRVRMSVEEFESRYGVNYALEDATGIANSASPTASVTGQGGSLARFKIVADYLYAIEWSSISVFDISDLDKPKTLEDVYTNGAVETIFNQGDILFLGGPQGMYIYDISSPAKPTYISEFTHGTACDPVVVDGDLAFVTLRSGNACGSIESGLYIIDVADLAKPALRKFHTMDHPYGLGFKNDKLFICEGSSGLKVFDKTDVDALPLLNNFEDIVAFDVIPLENSLLLIGDKVLYQYEYLENDIRLLSSLQLN